MSTSFTYTFYVEVNESNKSLLCSPATSSMIFDQVTQYPSNKNSNKGKFVTYDCNANSSNTYDSSNEQSQWPYSGVNATWPVSNNNITPDDKDKGSGNNQTIPVMYITNGLGTIQFADENTNPMSIYNYSGFQQNVSNPISLRSLWNQIMYYNETNPVPARDSYTDYENNDYITTWFDVTVKNLIMRGTCAGGKVPVSDHGIAENILGQSFMSNKCNKWWTNTLWNSGGGIPYATPLAIGPFCSYYDPGSLLAGGTVNNSWVKEDTAQCENDTDHNQCAFLNGWSEVDAANTFCPSLTNIKNFTPMCHFYNSAGLFGMCNVCGYCMFEVGITYYPLSPYTSSPSVTDDVYTPVTFPTSSGETVGYYNLSPLTTTPSMVMGMNMSGMPTMETFSAPENTVVNQNPDGTPENGWNFNTTQIIFGSGTGGDSTVGTYMNVMNTHKIYGVYKLEYTLTADDFQQPNFQYKLFDFLQLQQYLYNTFSPWFVGGEISGPDNSPSPPTTYWTTTQTSITNLLIDYCQQSGNMNSNLCSGMNLSFDFIKEAPCLKNPLASSSNNSSCIDAWANYCSSEENFFSETCQNVFINAYESDGSLNENIVSVLQKNCANVSNSTSPGSLSSDFLETCGCFLPNSFYTDVMNKNPSVSDQLGGVDKRQCWYLPCVYANIKPNEPSTFQCNNNDITRCIQRVVATFQDQSGTLEDNNVQVDNYFQGCTTVSTQDTVQENPTTNPDTTLTPTEMSSFEPQPKQSSSTKKFVFNYTNTFQIITYSALVLMIFFIVYTAFKKPFFVKLNAETPS